MKSNIHQINDQMAFVLHAVPWRETSQIVEVFSINHGRIPLVAKGSKRPRSPIRGLLMPFQPLKLSWSGNNELRTLRNAEWLGGISQLSAQYIYCGFYLNELLIKLLPRDDPHQYLFEKYYETVKALSNKDDIEPLLRSFEYSLLQELGFSPSLTHDGNCHTPIDKEKAYVFDTEKGMIESQSFNESKVQFQGKTLLDLNRSDFSDTKTLIESKILMRLLLNQCLADNDLQTRRILQELPLL
ncbi:MAG: DNA repair protein RecO [Ferrovum sp. 37-45-19]|jgi:DNA repair protein RecO (recombination protein O)|uniref:DNA repair protein RecO n=1 Tax=Ferrovum sp. JA12 TaxID=1356299 RepID=UPI000702524F|nr:DNA repair protein RecO [Ferrovum sp. JA12]OYV80307.1 MAG: DNA repair protein RecO [Ferrovum sp. 21-44-67]OYV95053.1 MAG: DNA repair protein RecO [Ferrovum sp. 37-45-19]OZB33615.1 MAG: DNA repair protein RecO [Ferrovum sp. 34-44-207]HQT80888.1 DNA repair protein RecO [Ferrovaceae bacterium]KRH78730.1 DNA repair protein RecO [Ferrovum sp. JA12]